MKLAKILFSCIMILLIASNSYGQLYIAGSFGVGNSDKNVSPSGAATIGVQFNHVVIQSGFHNQLSAKKPTLYRLTSGLSFEVGKAANIIFTGGIGSFDSHYDNNKKTVINQSGTWVGSFEYSKDYMGKGSWFFETTQAGKTNFVTAGLKYYFVSRKNMYGCPSTKF